MIKAINELLEPMRERRRQYEERPDLVTQIMEKGTRHAREVGETTMADVRKALRIDYF